MFTNYGRLYQCLMYENGVNHDSVLFLYYMLEAGNNLYVVCVQWIQEAGLLPLCSGPWLRGSTPSSSNASPPTSRKKLLANPSYSEAHRQDITHKCSNVLCVCVCCFFVFFYHWILVDYKCNKSTQNISMFFSVLKRKARTSPEALSTHCKQIVSCSVVLNGIY